MSRPSSGSSTSSNTVLCSQNSAHIKLYDPIHILEIIVGLLQFVIEEQVALGQLKISELEGFDNIITEYVR